jgi:hypothetical protein
LFLSLCLGESAERKVDLIRERLKRLTTARRER